MVSIVTISEYSVIAEMVVRNWTVICVIKVIYCNVQYMYIILVYLEYKNPGQQTITCTHPFNSC